MREVKFRVWDKELKKMEYYGPKFYVDDEYCELNFVPTDEEGDVILQEGTNENLIAMLYTGLKDKNDKEIWEEDIIEIDKTIRPDFIWLDKPFVVEIPDIYRLFERHVLGNEVKIIGNIHKNPELLKED